MAEKKNLIINGSGSYPGGTFDCVSINGSGKITGDIQCEKFATSGNSKVEGNVRCQKFVVNGSSKLCGDILGEEMKINGSCKVEGDLSGGKLTICGATTIRGEVKVKNLEIYGAAQIEKDIEAEEVRIAGGVKHHGFINAERVWIQSRASGGSVTFNEIGATEVSINQQKEEGFWMKFIGLFQSSQGGVVGQVIEADHIKVESANIHTLRGKNIEIGPECFIDTVEYTDTLNIHETSKVKSIVQFEKSR